jgi:hypothetical protein
MLAASRRTRGAALRHAGIVSLAVAVLLVSPGIRAASIVRAADLAELVEESEVALAAEVVKVRYGKDDRGLHSTWVTVRVDDPIFGDRLPSPGEFYTFKSYGAPVRMPDGSRVFIDGTPLYRTGDTLLLMLLPVSRWGFSGTAGLSQGVFRLTGSEERRSARGIAGAPARPYPELRRSIVELAGTAGKEMR